MKSVWIINYSLVFFAILILINTHKIKDQSLGYVAMGFSSFAIIVFLTEGLYNLSELGSNFLYLRYISIALVALLLASGYNYVRQESIKSDFKIAFDFLLHTTILWVASSELIHWMEIADSTQSYKLGLSILWGMYSLLLIGLGIWKKKKHLRIGAIILFAVTLVKLFFYDISHLDTIAKTIVFVSLGILLLIISFLYNKYKVSISGEV